MKRSKKMLLFLGVLVLLVGGYFLVGSLTGKENVSEESGTFQLSEAMGDAITSLRWTKDGLEIALVKTDGQWAYTGDAAFPVDQDAVQSLCDKLAAISASRKLTGITELGDFGLTEPVCKVAFALSGDAEIEYAMGADTALDSAHYMSSSADAGSVFISASDLETMFDKTLNQLAKQEALPTIESYTRLTVTAVGLTTLDQTRESERWTRTGTKEYAADSTVDAVMTAITGLGWNELVTYQAEDMTQYGLTDEVVTRVTVYDGETEVFALLLGGKDSSGNTYARLPDSQMVYTITSANATSLTGTSDSAARQKSVTDIAWDHLAAFTYDYDGTAHTALLTRETIGEGDEATTTLSATLDGASYDADALKAIYNAFKGLSCTGVSDAVNNGISVLTVTVQTTDGAEESFALRVNDVDTYLLDTGVERPLLVSADGVDKLIRQLKGL